MDHWWLLEIEHIGVSLMSRPWESVSACPVQSRKSASVLQGHPPVAMSSAEHLDSSADIPHRPRPSEAICSSDLFYIKLNQVMSNWICFSAVCWKSSDKRMMYMNLKSRPVYGKQNVAEYFFCSFPLP